MWDLAAVIVAEFAKGGLLVLFLVLILALCVGVIVVMAKDAKAERKASAKEIADLKKMYDAKFDALRERFQDKFDGLIDKYNSYMLASVKQTEGYIEASRNVMNLIVELKTALGLAKDQILILTTKLKG